MLELESENRRLRMQVQMMEDERRDEHRDEDGVREDVDDLLGESDALRWQRADRLGLRRPPDVAQF